MNPPAHSLSYKLAKWQLARRPWKYSVAIFLVLSLLWFAFAFWSDGGRTMNLVLGWNFLLCAYFEWEHKGYRQLIEEQAKLLEEARAKAEIA